MLINLTKHLNKQRPEKFVLTLKERLPAFVIAPCEIQGHFAVKRGPNALLLTFEIQGTLNLICQRCFQHFTYSLLQQNQVAVCEQEEIASALLSSYETIVAPDYQINFEDIIIDELHLSLMDKHLNEEACLKE